MKAQLLFILLILPCIVFSQSQDSVYQYCQVRIVRKLASRKVTLEVDYGQEQKLFERTAAVKDANGELRQFNSIADALNYMALLGWRLVQVFPSDSGATTLTGYHYLMESRKKVK